MHAAVAAAVAAPAGRWPWADCARKQEKEGRPQGGCAGARCRQADRTTYVSIYISRYRYIGVAPTRIALRAFVRRGRVERKGRTAQASPSPGGGRGAAFIPSFLACISATFSWYRCICHVPKHSVVPMGTCAGTFGRQVRENRDARPRARFPVPRARASTAPSAASTADRDREHRPPDPLLRVPPSSL